jgi:hypothetical protein
LLTRAFGPEKHTLLLALADLYSLGRLKRSLRFFIDFHSKLVLLPARSLPPGLYKRYERARNSTHISTSVAKTAYLALALGIKITGSACVLLRRELSESSKTMDSLSRMAVCSSDGLPVIKEI